MIQHRSFSLLMVLAQRRGAHSPADFSRSPYRQGGIWYAEVRHD